MRAKNEGWWWFFSYPALLCAYAHGVTCSDKEDWTAAITAARDAGSGHARGELRLPPESQDSFFKLLFDGADGWSPVLRFANRIADWLFALTESWIPRRAEFDRAFDRFDVLMCSLSLRGNNEWRPRCSIARDPSEGGTARGSYDDTVEYWLLNRLLRAERGATDEPLIAVFADNESDKIFDRIRNWNPTPTPPA